MKRATFRAQDWVNTRWYDITRRVTTCGEESAAGNGHQPAWTSVVHYWFKRLHAEPGFEDRMFIDVGCGKGKVLLAWSDMLNRYSVQQDVVGLEADGVLAQLARQNMQARDYEAYIRTGDALSFPFQWMRQPLIVWLFNPFGLGEIRDLAYALQDTDTLLVYHNPKHADVWLDAGWMPVSIKPGVHEKNTSMLLSSRWL